MRYIISSQPLSLLQRIKIPKKDKYGNLDLDLFFSTEDGKNFLSIVPLVLSSVKDKKELFYNVSMDISWISLCYNCDLYIYVMSDNWFYKNLDLNFHRHANFGNCSELQNLHIKYGTYDFPEAKMLKLPLEMTYFCGDMCIIEKEISENLKDINLREKPISSYVLNLEKGLLKLK